MSRCNKTCRKQKVYEAAVGQLYHTHAVDCVCRGTESTEYIYDITIRISIACKRPRLVETQIRFFVVLVRTKQLQDNKIKEDESEIPNLFLATPGCEAFRKILLMIYPTEFEELTCNQVRDYSKECSTKEKVGLC